MASLFNNSTGKWEEVDDSQVPAAVSSGSHSMESGMRIPVVRPDGNMAEIDTADSGAAFSKGYRLPTIHDQDAYYDKKTAQINKERFGTGAGNMAMAAGLGAARGASFGLSDLALKAGGLAEPAAQLKEQNPVSSTVGEVGGAVASSLALPGGGLVGAADRAGAGIAKLGGEALASRGASGIVSKLATKGLGSAVEGAFYGGGQTISEQALGNPDDVVDNLVSNVGFGALYGGALGAGFEGLRAARPYLENVARKTYQTGADLINSQARKAAGSVLENVVTARGDADLAQQAKRMAVDPELRQTAAEARAATSGLDKEIKTNTAELERQSKSIQSGLKDELEDQPDSVKELVSNALKDSDNDIAGASRRLYENIREGDKLLQDHLANTLSDQAPVLKDQLQSTLDSTVGILKKGNEADQAMASKLQGMADARVNSIHSAADEVVAGKALTEEISDIRSLGLSDEGRKAILEDLRPGLKDMFVKSYPDDTVKAYFEHISDNYRALKAVTGATSTASKVSKLFIDPTKQEGLNAAFSQLSSLAPEFKAFQEASKNVAAQAKVVQNAYKSYREQLIANKLQAKPLSASDFHEFFNQFGTGNKKNVADALDKLSSIEKATNTEGLSNIDAAVQLRKALGHSTQDLEQYAPMASHIDTLNRLDALGAADANSPVPIVRALIGYKTGGASELLRAGINAYKNPTKVLNALSMIEKGSNKGAQLLDKATQYAAQALTGRVAERGAFLAEMATYKTPDTQKARLEQYKTVTSNLNRFNSSPDETMDHLQKVSDGVEGIPNIKSAMAQKFSQGVGYLQAHAPKDPLAGKTMFSQDTGYQPSDAEMSSFMRRVEVVHNPMVAVKAVADGEVTPEQIDTLKSVYPNIYSKLQTKTISAIMDHGSDIPYQKKLVASQVFGIPADYSMTPQFIQAMQASLQPTDQGGRPDGAKDSSQRKPKLDVKPFETVGTETDAITYKGQNQ